MLMLAGFYIVLYLAKSKVKVLMVIISNIIPDFRKL